MSESLNLAYRTDSGETSSLKVPVSFTIQEFKKELAKKLSTSLDSLSLSLPNVKSFSEKQTIKSLNLSSNSYFVVSTEISEVPSKDFYNQLLKKINGKDLDTFIEIIEEWEESFDLYSLINSSNGEGWTLAHHSCYKGTSEILEYLIKRGAMCNSESEDAWTPLQLACYNGHTACIKGLVNHPQLQINRSTSRGTALHQASRRGQSQDLHILLDHGACMTIEDPNGLIPLQVASSQEVFEIIPKYMGRQLIDSMIKKEDQLADIEVSVTIENQDLIMRSNLNEGLIDFKYRNLQSNEFKVIKVYDIFDLREVTPNHCVIQGKFGLIDIKTENCREMIGKMKNIINHCHILKIGYTESKEPEFTAPISVRRSRAGSFTQVTINNFQIISKIFESPFASYFSSILKDSSSTFTIKQISKSENLSLNRTKYFVNESKILQQIRHNFIAKLVFAFQSKDYLYLAFENLKENLTKTSLPMSLPAAKNLIAQVITALEYLHSRDIVFRNLSPANIWLDPAGNAKLMNFETAKEGVNVTNKTRSFVGTLAFVAPELFAKDGHEKPCDIYALGPCLFYCLTGQSVFKGEDVKSLVTAVKMGNFSTPSNFPFEVKDFICKVMQKDPNLRPSIESLKNCSFLRDVNWNDLSKKRVLTKKSLSVVKTEVDESFDDQIILEENNQDAYEDVEDFDYFGSLF
jgi:hypothetical protein